MVTVCTYTNINMCTRKMCARVRYTSETMLAAFDALDIGGRGVGPPPRLIRPARYSDTREGHVNTELNKLARLIKTYLSVASEDACRELKIDVEDMLDKSTPESRAHILVKSAFSLDDVFGLIDNQAANALVTYVVTILTRLGVADDSDSNKLAAVYDLFDSVVCYKRQRQYNYTQPAVWLVMVPDPKTNASSMRRYSVATIGTFVAMTEDVQNAINNLWDTDERGELKNRWHFASQGGRVEIRELYIKRRDRDPTVAEQADVPEDFLDAMRDSDYNRFGRAEQDAYRREQMLDHAYM